MKIRNHILQNTLSNDPLKNIDKSNKQLEGEKYLLFFPDDLDKSFLEVPNPLVEKTPLG